VGLVCSSTPQTIRLARRHTHTYAHESDRVVGRRSSWDNVDFETLDDVNLGEMVVIPKGSMAMATVTEAVPKRRMARGGKLGMNIDYVRLPTGGNWPSEACSKAVAADTLAP